MSEEHFTLSSVCDESEASRALRHEIISKLAAEWLEIEAGMDGEEDNVVASMAREQAYGNALASGANIAAANAFADRIYDKVLDNNYSSRRLNSFGDKIQRQIAIENVIAMLGGCFTPP